MGNGNRLLRLVVAGLLAIGLMVVPLSVRVDNDSVGGSQVSLGVNVASANDFPWRWELDDNTGRYYLYDERCDDDTHPFRVWFYEDSNFGDPKMVLCGYVTNFDLLCVYKSNCGYIDAARWNDRVSSYKMTYLRAGKVFTYYADRNGGGACVSRRFVPTYTSYVGDSWNDRISSINAKVC